VLELLTAGVQTPTALAEQMPVTRQAVSKHLDALEAAGLVRGSRSGRERRFSLEPRALEPVDTWMRRLEAQWDRRLAALAALFPADAGPGRERG
jgi:DNA-binding transcriptional ArsR family regulator